jgi:hypothetical protein
MLLFVVISSGLALVPQDTGLLGAGRHRQLPLLPGRGLPFGAVGHDRGKHGLALPVGIFKAR